MNAKFARFVGLSLVLYTLLMPTLLSTSAAPRQQPDMPAGEPNNSYGAANSIVIGSTIEETIAPANDVDWYAFTVDQQGELQLTITNVAEELAINVRVWDAERNTVSNWFAPLAAGGDTAGVVDLAQPGRYFLEVADGAGNVESLQPYSLLAEFTPTVDVDEPNNSFGSASPITLEQPYQANILPASDVDWYSFEVAGHGELTLQISDVASDMAVSVRLWNSNRDTVSDWVSPLAQGGETNGVLDLPEAGTYFLEVAADSGERSTQPYTLEANFIPAVDNAEPNNTFGKAAPFTLGETIAANILPRNDTDWYGIEVDHHGELSVAVTNVPAELAIRVRVWNSNRDTVSDWLSPLAVGGETIGTFDLAAAGSYYLEFVDANSARSIEPFNITLSYIAAIDPYDNNDSFGRAGALTLGQSLPSNILPRGDSDWHKLELDHHGELQIVVSDVPENLDINFRVWNSNKDTVSNWVSPLARGGNTSGVVDIPAAGTYYIEVVDGSGDARSTDSFLLQALFIPAADQGEPNNTLETAIPAELDTTIPANIVPANDSDWYQVELAESGDLHVLVTNVAPTLQVVFRLWNEDEEAISDWTYPLAAGGNTEATFTLEEAGVYYLEVVDNRGNRSIQPYLLRFSLDEIDPDTMTFIQTVTSTDTLTDTVSTVEEGTETVTETTTIVTTTITVQATSEIEESGIVTTTESITDTNVITRPAPPSGGTPSTPTTPGTPAGGSSSDEAGGEEDDTAPPATTITETAPLTGTTEITETEEITTTSPATTTGTLPPVARDPNNPPGALIAEIPEGELITVEGVVAVLPTGWQSAAESGPFRGLALNPDDLIAATPQGPRLWVLTPGVEDLEFTGMLEPTGDTVEFFEETTTFLIGEQSAVAFALQESFGDQTIIRRYVFVTTGAGESYQFILEAPADQWDEQVALLEGILASILSEPS